MGYLLRLKKSKIIFFAPAGLGGGFIDRLLIMNHLFSSSHRLQNGTKLLMQQTNEALQQLHSTRVLTEADQV